MVNENRLHDQAEVTESQNSNTNHHQISSDDNCYSQRMRQYLDHIIARPGDNSISYWQNFVSEFFALDAKIRWCFSIYANNDIVVTHYLKEIPCNICKSPSAKGYEAAFDIFPRLFKSNFGGGVLNEVLSLQLPEKQSLPSGDMMLDYDRVMLERIFEDCRTVHEGKLRVLFKPDLKILSWEFCVVWHDVFLNFSQIGPQLNQFRDAVLNIEDVVTDIEDALDSDSDSSSVQADLDYLEEEMHSLLDSAGQIAEATNLPMIDKLGFPREYTRCLAMAPVLNIMNDLMDFSNNNRIGPIESLRRIVELPSSARTERQNEENNVGGQQLNEGEIVGTLTHIDPLRAIGGTDEVISTFEIGGSSGSGKEDDIK